MREASTLFIGLRCVGVFEYENATKISSRLKGVKNRSIEQ